MARFYTYIIVALFLYENAIGQDTACPANLIHYWKFDDEDSLMLRDYIGNADAFVIDETFPDSGIIGGSQSFDESKLSVFEPEFFDWDSNSSFTIEVWINTTSQCNSQSSIHNSVIIGRDANEPTGLHWWLGISCTNPGKINFSLYSNGFEGQVLESNRGVIDGEWHLVSVVRNGEEGTTSIIIDGETDTTGTFFYNNDFASDDSVDIGWLNLHNFYQFDGRMDELAVYNTALGASVLRNHYNTNLAYCGSSPTDTSVTDTTISVTILFSGMTPNIGQDLTTYLYDSISAETVDSLIISPLDNSQFSVVFDSVEAGTYSVDIWADADSSHTYNIPPADHAWRIGPLVINKDTIIEFSHNTDFTDIFGDGTDTTDTDTGSYQLTIVFTGFEQNVGQDLTVFLRDPATEEFVDSLILTPIDTGEFNVTFDSVSATDSFNLDFYTDVNGNGTYDIPPVDHAWRIEIMDFVTDTVINFAYDTVFTDIGLVATGNNDLENPGFSIYPNPAGDELTIYLENGGYNAGIYMVTGGMVLNKELSLSEKIITLNVSSLKAGIYVLRVTTQSGSSYLKFLKD